MCGLGKVKLADTHQHHFVDRHKFTHRKINQKVLFYCLPKGRHSEAGHEIQGCSSQKFYRGRVGWGGVGHAGEGWVIQT